MLTGGCASKVKPDLKNYITSLEKVFEKYSSEMAEVDAKTKIECNTQERYDCYRVIYADEIPLVKKIKADFEGLNPETPEVKEINVLFIEGFGLMLQAFEEGAESIKSLDEKRLKKADKTMKDAHKKFKDADEKIKSLSKKHLKDNPFSAFEQFDTMYRLLSPES
jgi:ElaB/YqjD/DUF883 family membrane-anchored ribosome-binding protein